MKFLLHSSFILAVMIYSYDGYHGDHIGYNNGYQGEYHETQQTNYNGNPAGYNSNYQARSWETSGGWN
ncbi:unnamed protein product [Caenorhabditis brenneri]